MAVSTVAGLNSGIQWGEMVDMLMQVARQPLVTIESRITTYQTQLTHWNSIETKLGEVNAAAEEMATMSDFLVHTVSSSDADLITVDADDQAIPGSHEVVINQLAKNHVLVHLNGWVDEDTTPINTSGNDQSFSLQYGEEVLTFNVPSGTTLRGLVNLINSDEDNPGVTASIINSGSGESAYHLMLSGNDTGEDNRITILDTHEHPTNLGDGRTFDARTWDTTIAPQNAEIRVDGFPDPRWHWPNPWIESDSNTVEGVIPGLVLNLKKTTAEDEPVLISVGTDTAAVEEKVDALISAYNALTYQLDSVSRYDAENETAGPLFGDSLVRSIKNQMMMLVGSNIPGTKEGDVYRTLGQVGIRLTSGGLLSLNTSKFAEALKTDPTAVSRLFVFDVSSTSSHVTDVSHTEATRGGRYNFTLSYNEDGSLNPEGTNVIDGQEVTIHGVRLFSGAEGSNVEGLLMKLSNPGNGPAELSGTLSVYTGLAAMFVQQTSRFTDTETGDLKYTRDRINDTIHLLDTKVDSWNTRLKAIRANYEREFQAMETLIGQMNSQGNFIEQMG